MNIKKLICLILALLMLACTSFVACGDDETPGGPDFEGDEFPDVLMGLDEYISASKEQKVQYYESFGNDEAFLKWYQEAYRLSGRKGAASSKDGYMKDFDKSGFPETVLTWEEYCACEGWPDNDGWRIQSPYYKAFEEFTDFSRWSHEAQRIYEEEQNREEIGDSDIEIDLSK